MNIKLKSDVSIFRLVRLISNSVLGLLLLTQCYSFSSRTSNSPPLEVIPLESYETYGMKIVSREVVERAGEMQCVVTLEITGICRKDWSASDFDLQFKNVHMNESEQYPDIRRGIVQRPSSQAYVFEVVLLGEKKDPLPGNESFKLKGTKTVILKDFKKPYRIKFQAKKLDVGYYSAD